MHIRLQFHSQTIAKISLISPNVLRIADERRKIVRRCFHEKIKKLIKTHSLVPTSCAIIVIGLRGQKRQEKPSKNS